MNEETRPDENRKGWLASLSSYQYDMVYAYLTKRALADAFGFILIGDALNRYIGLLLEGADPLAAYKQVDAIMRAVVKEWNKGRDAKHRVSRVEYVFALDAMEACVRMMAGCCQEAKES